MCGSVLRSALVQLMLAWVLFVSVAPSRARAANKSCSISKFEIVQKLVAEFDYVQARKILYEQIKRRPRCGLLWFNFGNVLYLQGDERNAILAYQKVIKFKSRLAPAAHLYIAKIHRRKGRLLEASGELEKISQAELPAAFAAQVEAERQSLFNAALGGGLTELKAMRYPAAESNLIVALGIRQSGYTYGALALALHGQGLWDRERTTIGYGMEIQRSEEERRILKILEGKLNQRNAPPSPYHLRADAAIGYDNNVLRVENKSAIGSQAYRLWTEVERNLEHTSIYNSSLRLGVSYDDFTRLPSERTTVIYANFMNAWNLGNWNFELLPQLGHESYNNRPFMLRPGIRGEMFRRKNQWTTGMIYEHWRGIVQNENFKYLGGYSHLLNIYQGYTSNDFLFAALSYSLFYNSSGDESDLPYWRIPTAFVGHGPALKIFLESLKWRLRLSYEFNMRSYFATALPEARPRRDTLGTLAARATYILKPEFNLYVQAQNQTRTSTMGPTSARNSNWDDLLVYAGVYWEVF